MNSTENPKNTIQTEIRLEDYQYELPEARIAQHPLAKRDEAKLLHYQKGKIAHHQFFELPQLLEKDTLLVFNNTKVIPARLYFRKATGALIEIFLIEALSPHQLSLMTQAHSPVVWKCMIGNKKRWKNGEVLQHSLQIGEKLLTLEAHLVEEQTQSVALHWNDTEMNFLKVLEYFGNLPLPPYLKRKVNPEDQQQYQTVYSKQEGAVAAPTAGLHFTERVLTELHQKEIQSLFITLHVGGGTFQPIKTEKITEHTMHLEQMIFSLENIIALRKQQNKPLVAVGTTSVRALESLYWFGVKLSQAQNKDEKIPFFVEKLLPYQIAPEAQISWAQSLELIEAYMHKHQLQELIGETEIFIFPGYAFKVCKAMITNYHLPSTTLILLIAAFIGEDWRKVYQAALDNEYRFLSYGDSSLLMP